MSFIILIAYNLLVLPGLALAVLAALPFSPKIWEGLGGRLGAYRRIYRLSRRGPSPRIWVHVSSAGEFLQAKPVIDEIKKRRPELKVFVSIFSPSAKTWLARQTQLEAWDFFASDDLLSSLFYICCLKPSALIFVKSDLWPNLINWARLLKIPLFLVSGTLGSHSLRTRWPLRSFFGGLYEQFDQIFAVSSSDLEQFHRASTLAHCVLGGDTRVDSVLERQQREARTEVSPSWKGLKAAKRPVFVGGSLWPRDEEIIFGGTWPETAKSLFWVLVPHEATPSALERLKKYASQRGLRVAVWSEQKKGDFAHFDVLLVDEMGLLAGLYRMADMAFVGTGDRGLHNSMEPAAWGVPLLFGSFYQNAPEAYEFLRLGAAVSVKSHKEFSRQLEHWIGYPETAKESGNLGLKWLLSSQGASAGCAQAMLEKVPGTLPLENRKHV